jgi:hypothetical protein
MTTQGRLRWRVLVNTELDAKCGILGPNSLYGTGKAIPVTGRRGP